MFRAAKHQARRSVTEQKPSTPVRKRRSRFRTTFETAPPFQTTMNWIVVDAPFELQLLQRETDWDAKIGPHLIFNFEILCHKERKGDWLVYISEDDIFQIKTTPGDIMDAIITALVCVRPQLIAALMMTAEDVIARPHAAAAVHWRPMLRDDATARARILERVDRELSRESIEKIVAEYIAQPIAEEIIDCF